VSEGGPFSLMQVYTFVTVHAWNYRRYVLANMPVERRGKTELAYTTRKIEASMSNFSAWHQRSKVLSSLWDSGELSATKSRDEGE